MTKLICTDKMLFILSVLFIGIIPLVWNEECQTSGDVRRVNLMIEAINELGNSFVQICLQSGDRLVWSHICSENLEQVAWTPDNGHVLCRSLKGKLSNQADSIGSVTMQEHGPGELKLVNVSCNRTEDGNVLACNHTMTEEACKYVYGISCSFCDNNNNDICNKPGFCSIATRTCECQSECLHGGFCDVGKCICRDPYYGESCEMKECDSPCVNNEVCMTNNGTCNCALPFYGDSCQFKMCPNLCSGKGACDNQTGTCECEPQYFGDSCRSQNCTPACRNNGTCDTSDGTCQCDLPYYGDYCQNLGTNCPSACLNGGSCNYTKGTCKCQGNFRGEQCELSQQKVNNTNLIYVGIAVCVILVVISLSVLAILLCLLFLKRRRTSKNSIHSKNVSSIEGGNSEIASNGTNKSKSRRKLKVNKTYSKNTQVDDTRNNIKTSNGLKLNGNRNGLTLIPLSTDKKSQATPEYEECYTQLGIAYYIIYEGEEVYRMFLNGEGPDDNIYESYARINESTLPNKNATIVLSQEERNSIKLQENEPIYETCIRRVPKTKVENFTDTNEYCEPPDNLPKIFDRMSYMKFREINPDTLKKQNPLGSGEFGMVYKGSWNTGQETIDVAIKILKSSAEDMKTAFMREAAIMGQFSHPNILKLMGILSLSEPFMIVTELMKSDLPTLLINFQTSGIKLSMLPPVLLNFCKEIATGMEYLASRNCVHRDLAARNVLLTKSMVCKIADFGMSREYKEEYDYYKCSGGLIPVKWTAPEAIFYRKYTEKSDVWAFGMTMFEIWSLGYKPWHDKSNEDILNKMQALQVLNPPTGCPKEIYDIMLETWNYDVEARATFTQLRQLLEKPIAFQAKTSDLLGNDPSLFKRVN